MNLTCVIPVASFLPPQDTVPYLFRAASELASMTHESLLEEIARFEDRGDEVVPEIFHYPDKMLGKCLEALSSLDHGLSAAPVLQMVGTIMANWGSNQWVLKGLKVLVEASKR